MLGQPWKFKMVSLSFSLHIPWMVNQEKQLITSLQPFGHPRPKKGDFSLFGKVNQVLPRTFSSQCGSHIFYCIWNQPTWFHFLLGFYFSLSNEFLFLSKVDRKSPFLKIFCLFQKLLQAHATYCHQKYIYIFTTLSWKV